jgi:hypothetical protein
MAAPAIRSDQRGDRGDSASMSQPIMANVLADENNSDRSGSGMIASILTLDRS